MGRWNKRDVMLVDINGKVFVQKTCIPDNAVFGAMNRVTWEARNLPGFYPVRVEIRKVPTEWTERFTSFAAFKRAVEEAV